MAALTASRTWTLPNATGTFVTTGDTGTVTGTMLNLTPTTCTNQFLTAISSGAVGTCTTSTLAGAQFANQGTTTTLLHGNAAGNPSWAAVSLSADVTGVTPAANGGTGQNTAAMSGLPYVASGVWSVSTSQNVQVSQIGIGGPPGVANNPIKFYGATSGFTVLQPNAAAGSGTLTLPTASGTLVGTGDSGVVTGTMIAATTVTSSNLNVTPTTCTNQFLTAISSGAVGTCTTSTLAGAQFANQGTTTTLLHGNAAGNPSWTAVSLANDVTGTLGTANGGTGQTVASSANRGCVKGVVTTATAITFTPFGGCNTLIIHGVLYTVPSAGFSCSNGGLAASTLYYLYATQTGGTVGCTVSLTGHITDSTAGNIGVEIIATPNSDLTLIGMAITNGAIQWVDSAISRTFRNWFNDSGIAGLNVFTVTRSTTASAYTELNSEIRITFLPWNNEIVHATFSGASIIGNTLTRGDFSLGFDGAVPEDTYSANNQTANSAVSLAMHVDKSGLSEASHFVTVLGSSSDNTNSVSAYVASNAAGYRGVLSLFARR